MIAWKAVAIINSKFQSWSCVLKNNPVIYTPGVVSKRPVEWGPLTAFKSYKHAKRFVQLHKRGDTTAVILRCNATKSRAKRLWIYYYDKKLFNVSVVNGFGEPVIEGAVALKIPAGTVFCDSITPLEVVWRGNES